MASSGESSSSPSSSSSKAYAELLARLLPARRFGVVFGLDRIRAVLDRLGAPDTQLGEVVHIGGTNGKGSTVAIAAAIARAAGLRVATYTSPHLSTLRERITIDGAMITEASMVAAAARASAAGADDLTFFEQITAIAMVAIADAQVDVTILEVGLGGRLDATNVVDAPVAVVTGVAMDHEAILGSTLDAIAGEKAGIFKRGRRAVIGASGEPSAVPWLVGLAHRAGCTVTIVDESLISSVPEVALAGEHQRANAAVAIEAMTALAASVAAGSKLSLALASVLDDRAQLAAALATVQHPGRFERIGDVVLDGAHNPHGARALATALRSLAPDSRGGPVLVLAVSADKDVAAIVGALAPVVRAAVVTRYQQDRAMAPEELSAVFASVAPGLRVDVAVDLGSALERARALMSSDTPRAAGTPVEAGSASVEAANPSVEAANPPVEAANPSVEAANPSVEAANPPVEAANPSVEAANPSVEAANPPVEAANPPVEAANPPVEAADPSVPPPASIVVAGSLFIVGEARVLLCGAASDPVWVSDPAATKPT